MIVSIDSDPLPMTTLVDEVRAVAAVDEPETAHMTLRWLLREAREFPATTILSALWLIVFLFMLSTVYLDRTPVSWSRLVVVGIPGGHQAGDLALEDLGRGEIWRLMTATFVHYSVLHIVLNLVAFYQLGTLLESWYGSHQFVFIYGLTAGAGNLISSLIRVLLGGNTHNHAGGGSVVVMGLVAMCAVVGLRSSSQTGRWLGAQMVGFMGLTALIGVALPGFIDNWGHLGGALVGLVLGFGNRRFVDQASRPSAWAPGVIAGVLIAACLCAQVLSHDLEARQMAYARHEQLRFRLYELNGLLEARKRQGPRGAPALFLISRIESLASDRALPQSIEHELRALRHLARQGADRPSAIRPGPEFDAWLNRVIAQVHRGYATARALVSNDRREQRARSRRAADSQRVDPVLGSLGAMAPTGALEATINRPAHW